MSLIPLVDSTTGKTVRDYSDEELSKQAAYMRGLNEIALCAAGSGHSGGTLSVMDICTALYLKVARHDPSNPIWRDRDRIIWSANHKAPALYTSLAVSGYFPERELMTLRMLGSPLQGHPHWRELPGVEMSGGSLGQGVSVGVGMALAGRLDGQDFRVFVISSDGEQQEGSVWEAAMSAAQYCLDNLILIIDKNGLQIDGKVSDVMNIEPLAEKYRAFGWQALELDGHNIPELTTQLDFARNHNRTGKPTVLICKTTKGRGVSFMENSLSWHGKAPSRSELDECLRELRVQDQFDVEALLECGRIRRHESARTLDATVPKFSRDFWWNHSDTMKVVMEPTRKGFGRALERLGSDERVVCIGADISDSICISDFHRNHPERRNRFISVGVAEQNATTIAAGLAREGKLPIFGTYGVFASARNLDQIRVSLCYANLDVLIAGAHGGVSVGPDGGTHQELEALFQMTGLPNMHVGVPCDAIETERMVSALLFEVQGPKYVRFARESTPVITRADTPFRFGEANIYRFRREAALFLDAFDIYSSSTYTDEREDVAIVSCGPATAEVLRAAYILTQEFDIQARVINVHTVKPIDRTALVRAAKETRAVITVEEHQVGGLGNLVAGIILSAESMCSKAPLFEMIGVEDRFGESGEPWQLIKKFGLSAEHVACRVKELLKLKR